MKKSMLVVITLFVVAIFQSCHKVNGTGAPESRTYNLSGFSAVDLNMDADLYFTQDSFYKVEIVAQPNIHEIIDARVAGSSLTLQFEKYKNVRHYDHIIVYITAPSLTGLAINGSGKTTVLNSITTDKLNVEVNGSGSLIVPGVTAHSLSARISGSGNIEMRSGGADVASAKISGSGEIDMSNVKATDVTVNTSGSGTTKLWATGTLDVEISGSGDVYYKGTPTVSTQISGSGKVRPM